MYAFEESATINGDLAAVWQTVSDAGRLGYLGPAYSQFWF